LQALTRRELGALGEELATARLREAGLAIRERNFRVRSGELDIVAQDGATLVFVEVKARLSTRSGRAAENVTAAKLQKMRRVALFYLKEQGYEDWPPLRFDVMAVEWPQGEPVLTWVKAVG
jgi:putative endonuclease